MLGWMGDPGEARKGVGVGESGSAVADLDEQGGCPDGAAPRQRLKDVGVGVLVEEGGDVVLEGRGLFDDRLDDVEVGEGDRDAGSRFGAVVPVGRRRGGRRGRLGCDACCSRRSAASHRRRCVRLQGSPAVAVASQAVGQHVRVASIGLGSPRRGHRLGVTGPEPHVPRTAPAQRRPKHTLRQPLPGYCHSRPGGPWPGSPFVALRGRRLRGTAGRRAGASCLATHSRRMRRGVPRGAGTCPELAALCRVCAATHANGCESG